jgi:hypothetical protein
MANKESTNERKKEKISTSLSWDVNEWQKKNKILHIIISHDLEKNKLCELLNIKKDYLIWLVEAFVDYTVTKKIVYSLSHLTMTQKFEPWFVFKHT